MAIKGKSKSRGARVVARGPKPAYVPVKTPLLRRSGLWISVLTALAAAVIGGLAIGFVQERNDEREREEVRRMAVAVNQYRGQIDPILQTLGSPVAPTGFDAFPELEAAIASLEAEDGDGGALDRAATVADDAAASARSAIRLIDQIPATDLLRGKDLSAEFVLYVVNSQGNLLWGLRLYREGALLTALAVEAEGESARDDVVARARGVLTVADEVFARGYSDYVEAQAVAEVFTPVAPGVPTATGPTG